MAMIKKKFNSLGNRLKALLDLLTNSRARIHRRWLKDDGELRFRYNYILNQDSVVFDVGGYKGEWSQRISELYNPYIYIFEPVKEYYQKIKECFKGNSKISVYNFGLADEYKTAKISLLDDKSSLYQKSEYKEEIKLRDIIFFLDEVNLTKISLIKINIEGGEYDLLERIIKAGIAEKFENIQVQFHNFIKDSIRRRKEIISILQKTHFITYSYPFIWENFRLKETEI